MQKRFLGLFASLAIVLTACGGTTATSAPPAASTDPGQSEAASVAPPDSNLAEEQVIRYAIVQDPATLDPNAAQDSVSIAVLQALHRGLVSVDKDLNVVPGLAESWEVSDDAQTLTFHLRDAKYSNGDPIVAGDLVFSWKRLADPRTAAPYSYVIAEVEGGPELLGMAGADPAPSDADIEAALDGLGVEAPDDKTFVVHLNTPATYFLSAMTLWVFVPLQESWITSDNATEAENYVSSGPFMLQSWDHNAEIVLVPNPNWYGDVKPTLTEVRMPIFADIADVQRAYEADEVDAVLPIPSADVQRIKGDPAFADQYAEVSTLSIAHYNFNTYQDPEKASYANPGPTKNLNFRIALVEAIDKVALRDATFSGLGVIANSFVMPGIPGYDETIDPYPYNPESAQEHMALALEELGVASAADLPPLRFGFNTGSDHESRVAFLAEAWRTQFGLQTDQIGSEFSVFLTQRTAGEYDISRNAWGADYPHANNQLSGLWTCGGGNNDSQWCSPEFDALLAKAAAEPDQTAQADLYKQAQALMMNDAPFIPLIYRVQPQLKKAYISSIDTPIDHQNPGDVFMESIQILKH